MPKSETLIEINGLSDINDYEKVVNEKGIHPIKAYPAPEQDVDGVINVNPHESRFEMPNGEMVSVFHMKPIYYMNKSKKWRPMGEIAEEFGNSYAKLKDGWHLNIHRDYFKWYVKRLLLLNANRGDTLVLKRDEDGNPLITVPAGLSAKVANVFTKIPQSVIDEYLNNTNW